MNSLSTAQSNILSILWPQEKTNPIVRNVVLAVAGSLLITLAAKIQVPFWPVPMTMQTFVILVIAMAYGPKLGVATLLLYLAEGAAGLPVFSGTPEKGIGLAYMAGPTGGYLFGFVAATGLLGFLNTKGWDKSFLTTLAAMVLGSIVILLCGYIWLASLIGTEKAWLYGVQPFLIGDALKIALASVTLPTVWKLIKKK